MICENCGAEYSIDNECEDDHLQDLPTICEDCEYDNNMNDYYNMCDEIEFMEN